MSFIKYYGFYFWNHQFELFLLQVRKYDNIELKGTQSDTAELTNYIRV